ncbi:hypothetical protein EI94DRAFT_1745414 [Lactarius quietus]|nr:hypothetical protein EI94DRAFT_1745414 [Lactarius quietus]
MSHPSSPRGPSDSLVQGEDHPVCLTATSEVPDLWRQCPLEWWPYYLAHFYSQEQELETASITSPRTEWPQSVDAATVGQKSPTLEQNQNPEKTPLNLPHDVFDGSFGNQAGAMPDYHTQAEYSEHITIQEEDMQLTGRQLPDQGIDSPSTPGGNVQLCHPRNAYTFPSDMSPSQVPQQHWEELQEARKYTDTAIGCDSESRGKAPRGLHRCTNCNKAYQRRQELKRHTRDKHVRHRKCPLCRTGWSRPERIRVHLLKQHGSLLTEGQQQEIRILRGRDNTIRFLEKYGNTTHPGSYTPD